MKVAVSITKVFEVDNMSIEDLKWQMEEEPTEDCIDWYDVEAEQEIWSYAIVKE